MEYPAPQLDFSILRFSRTQSQDSHSAFSIHIPPSTAMTGRFWYRNSSSSSTPTSTTPVSEPPTPKPLQLQLSATTRDCLERLADATLHETMARYRVYREQFQRRVPADQWKQIKRCANLTVYRERPTWRKRDQQRQDLLRSLADPLVANAASKSATNSTAKSTANAPNVLVVGSLQGSLDDELYGAFVGSDQAARLRSSYLDDGLQEFEWLATLRSPTPDDPFHSCGVARAVLAGAGGNEGSGSGVASYGMGRFLPLAGRRELCVVISMGLTKTADGERVGFYVLQSVDLSCADSIGRGSVGAAWRARKRPARAVASMCWLKSELRGPVSRLELFAHGSLGSAGSGLGASRLAPRAALSLAMTSDVAYAKKLHWMMRDALSGARRCVAALVLIPFEVASRATNAAQAVGYAGRVHGPVPLRVRQVARPLRRLPSGARSSAASRLCFLCLALAHSQTRSLAGRVPCLPRRPPRDRRCLGRRRAAAALRRLRALHVARPGAAARRLRRPRAPGRAAAPDRAARVAGRRCVGAGRFGCCCCWWSTASEARDAEKASDGHGAACDAHREGQSDTRRALVGAARVPSHRIEQAERCLIEKIRHVAVGATVVSWLLIRATCPAGQRADQARN